MDLTPHSFVTSRASGRLLNVVHCSRRITCQNLLFITCFYQSSSAPRYVSHLCMSTNSSFYHLILI
uniref:Uncharacterized protein n=1 Tax=Hordeum vulgare subsp. vulgare TaxID=112509 RepID=A0A8I7B639_HORVV